MANDKLFFRPAAKLNKNNSPSRALVFQCIWASLLCFSGSYGDLLDYIMFPVMIFYVLTVSGLFILRKKRPDVPRPYKAFGYPFLPAFYILLAAAVAFLMLINNNENCIRGLIIMLIGIPVYFIFKKTLDKTSE